MFQVSPVAYVSNLRDKPIDDHWDQVESIIQLTPEFSESALAGLEQFSHAEIVFLFHQVHAETIVNDTRHPRNNPEWPKVGIFSQRGKNRPNRIGTTLVKIVKVEGIHLHVRGLDAIDGTPVIDIKPVMLGFLPRSEISEPEWSSEIMRQYW